MVRGEKEEGKEEGECRQRKIRNGENEVRDEVRGKEQRQQKRERGEQLRR